MLHWWVSLKKSVHHDDVIRPKHLPRYVTGPLCGNSPVTGEFPAQRPVTRSFDVFIDLRLEETIEQTIVMQVIWDAIALIMTSL